MAALPPAYAEFLVRAEALMHDARKLGLYRTTDWAHQTLNTARAEVWEALPPPVPRVEFTIGPVTEQ